MNNNESLLVETIALTLTSFFWVIAPEDFDIATKLNASAGEMSIMLSALNLRCLVIIKVAK